MAVYSGASYRPLNQFSYLDARPRFGAVLHVNASDGPSLYDWIAGGHDMSCHFQIARDGHIEQYVDTNNGAWCQGDGNWDWISIETQGYPTEPLTDAQINAAARIMRWLHDLYGIPLQISDSVNVRGLGWHGMGGEAWGGHDGCPGDLRKAQRVEIVLRAKPPEGDEDMQFGLIKAQGHPEVYAWSTGGMWWHVPDRNWLAVLKAMPECAGQREVSQAEFDAKKAMVASAWRDA